jgi:hypothetical protein
MATPAMYEINEKLFLVIGGSKPGAKSGDAYAAFAFRYKKIHIPSRACLP